MTDNININKYILCRLISGGQTGVDRAALDTALELGIPAGGWCPAGRRSARGAIPSRYPLVETSTPAYPHRTRLNIRDSDATLVFTRGEPAGGTRLTVELAIRLRRPVLIIDLARTRGVSAHQTVIAWLREITPNVLNIAGPRASEAPGLGRNVRLILRNVLAPPSSADEVPAWPPPRPRTPRLPGMVS